MAKFSNWNTLIESFREVWQHKFLMLPVAVIMAANLVLIVWRSTFAVAEFTFEQTSQTVSTPVGYQIATGIYLVISIYFGASMLMMMRKYIDGNKNQKEVLWLGSPLFWKYLGLSILLGLIMLPIMLIVVLTTIVATFTPLLIILGVVLAIAYFLWFIFNYFFAQVEITGAGVFDALRNTRTLWKANKKAVMGAVGTVILFGVIIGIIYMVLLTIATILTTSIGALPMIIFFIVSTILLIPVSASLSLFLFKVWKHIKKISRGVTNV